MMFELVDDTMTYIGNVPEIFSMRDHLYVAPTLDTDLDMDLEYSVFLPNETLDLEVA